MAKIQPALCIANGVASDRHLVVSEGSGGADVFLGIALLERGRGSEEVLQHKMLVGRLVNGKQGTVPLGFLFGFPTLLDAIDEALKRRRRRPHGGCRQPRRGVVVPGRPERVHRQGNGREDKSQIATA